MSPVVVYYFVRVLVYSVCQTKVSSQLCQQLSKPVFLCFRGEIPLKRKRFKAQLDTVLYVSDSGHRITG